MINVDFPSKSPLLPNFSFKLFNHTIEPSVVEELKQLVIDKEKHILSTTPIQEGETDPNWLTGRLWHYNFLDFDNYAVEYLKKEISKSYRTYMESIGVDPLVPVYIQCWANIIRNNGRIITPHHHADAHGEAPFEYSYLSGNICLDAVETNTYYGHPFFNSIAAAIKNNPGEMILFPSFIVHWTDPNLAETPRISLAFDIITEEVYNMIENSNYRKLEL